MPFKWREIFQRENDLAKAGATRALEAHADPHAVIDTTIRQYQEDHDRLENAVATVMGQAETAKGAYERDLALVDRLDRQGKAAFSAGHRDAAAGIARQLAAARERLSIEEQTYHDAKKAADDAQEAFRVNGEKLAAALADAKTLHAQVDQQAVQHNLNRANEDIASMAARATPSLNEVRERVQQGLAKERASGQLHALDTAAMGLDDSTLAQTGAADELMAGWADEAPQPVKATRVRDALPEGGKRDEPRDAAVKGTDALFS
jgi:phage shock protein A